jgi:acyl-coenzyme A thioesterase PaaI-like protein
MPVCWSGRSSLAGEPGEIAIDVAFVYGPGYTATAMTDTNDPVLDRALLAVGRTRALGLHFYGNFVGIGGRPAPLGTSRLTIDGEPPGVGAPGVSPVALATVADLAIGSAIRSHLEIGARMATATLSIQHPIAPVDGPVTGLGEAEDTAGDQKSGRCVLVAPDGRPVGYAHGWFAALPPPPGWVQRPLPWEWESPPSYDIPARSDIDRQEEAALVAALAAGDRARHRGTSISEELLHFRWQPSAEGRALGDLTNGPELANRVGHIQGGALYGAAAIVAAQALGASLTTLVDGHYQFLRIADGALLHGEASVLRRGRLASFVEAQLSVDGKPVGYGLFSFRS